MARDGLMSPHAIVRSHDPSGVDHARGIGGGLAIAASAQANRGPAAQDSIVGQRRIAPGSTINEVAPSVVAEQVAPTITETMINGGATQRSRITSLMMVFSSQVTFAGSVANAFTLVNQSGVPVTFDASASVVNGVTVVLLSNFTGGATQGGSLADGRFTLTALASQISAQGQPLDGNHDGVAGDNFTSSDGMGLMRMFGDINGDHRVDQTDFLAFTMSLFNPANYNNAFDFNNDGRIDIADFGQFSLRFQPPVVVAEPVPIVAQPSVSS